MERSVGRERIESLKLRKLILERSGDYSTVDGRGDDRGNRIVKED